MKFSPRKFIRRARTPFKSGVSLLIVFVLATHALWCSAGTPACASEASSTTSALKAEAHPAAAGSIPNCDGPAEPENHQHETCCGGIDETQTVASHHRISVQPLDVVTIDIVSVLAITAQPLILAENLYRRDGPEVRVLRSHLSRNILLGRAPPASL